MSSIMHTKIELVLNYIKSIKKQFVTALQINRFNKHYSKFKHKGIRM